VVIWWLRHDRRHGGYGVYGDMVDDGGYERLMVVMLERTAVYIKSDVTAVYMA